MGGANCSYSYEPICLATSCQMGKEEEKNRVVEGEGSFHILNKDYYLRFSIGQSSKDLALMEELKLFNNLGKP